MEHTPDSFKSDLRELANPAGFHQGVLPDLPTTQLLYWQTMGHQLPTYNELGRMRCRLCHQNIVTLADVHGTLYNLTEDNILAAKVAHIRQRHEKEIGHGTGEFPATA